MTNKIEITITIQEQINKLLKEDLLNNRHMGYNF